MPNSRCLSYSPHLLPLLYPPHRSTVGWHHQSVTPVLFLPDPATVTVPVSFFAHSACTKERTGSSGWVMAAAATTSKKSKVKAHLSGSHWWRMKMTSCNGCLVDCVSSHVQYSLGPMDAKSLTNVQPCPYYCPTQIRSFLPACSAILLPSSYQGRGRFAANETSYSSHWLHGMPEGGKSLLNNNAWSSWPWQIPEQLIQLTMTDSWVGRTLLKVH